MPGSALSEKIKVTNWLIQQGANLTTTAEDILEDFNLENQSVQSSFVQPDFQGLSEKSAAFGKNALDNYAREDNVLSIERRVIDLLGISKEPMTVNNITRALGETATAVSSVLVMLELK